MFDICCFFPNYKPPLMKSWVPTDFPGETVGISCLCFFVYSTKCIIYIYNELSIYIYLSIYKSICIYIYKLNYFLKIQTQIVGMFENDSNFIQFPIILTVLNHEAWSLCTFEVPRSQSSKVFLSSSPEKAWRGYVAPGLVSSNFRGHRGHPHQRCSVRSIGFNPSEKIWKSVEIIIPNIWKVIKFMFQTTNQRFTLVTLMGCNEHLVVPDDSISLSLARRGVSQLAGEPRSLSTYKTYK
jgi:hypothetical protein